MYNSQGTVPVNVRVTPVAGALSAAGSFVVDGFPLTTNEVVINVATIASGSSITFTATEVDRGDGATALGAANVGGAISAAGTQKIGVSCSYSGCILVSWTVTGSGAAHVYVSVVGGVASGGGGGGGGTVTEGSAATLSGEWPVELTDGTHGPAAVKPASTAAVATDPALVVAVSPNSAGPGQDVTNGVQAQEWKPLTGSTYAPNVYTELGTAASGNVKATAGNLFAFRALNVGATDLYLWIFNSTGSTAGAAADIWYVPAGSQIIVGVDFYSQSGVYFSAGITFGFSTSVSSFTAGTAANCFLTAVYW